MASAAQAARTVERERPAAARSGARRAAAASARTAPAPRPARRSTSRRSTSGRAAHGGARPARARTAAATASPARVVRLRAAAPSPAGMLDGLLRGRAWVACIGLLLAGIVFLNVSLLEVNGGIANVSERSAALKRENAELQLKVAELASSERIQAAAAERGYSLPAPAAVTYLRSKSDSDARRAARAMERGTLAQAPPAPTLEQPEAAAGTPPGAAPAAPVTPAAPATPTAAPPVADAPAAPASDG